MDTPQKPNSALSLAELVGKLNELTKELEKLKSGFMNQNKLNAFFFEEPVPLLCINRELKIHFANRVLLKLIGSSKEKILNKELAELIYTDNNLDELKTNLQKLFDEKISLYEDIIDFKTANKSKINFKIKARLVKYDDEIKKAVHITFQDVSQEYKFREAYKNLVENSLQAILIIQDFRIVFANQKAAEISGYSTNELYSLDINGVKQLIHPDDRERLFNLMKESIGGKRVYPKHEVRGIRKNKETYWLEVLVSPINYNKKPALQVVQLDVSDKKKAQDEINTVEHKFKILVEHSIIGVYIIKNGVFTYVNPRLASIFGYKQEELINVSPQKIVYREDLPDVEENLRKRIEGEVDSLHYEFRGIRKNNQIIFVEVHGSRTMLDGEPAVIGMLQDVTERKENEAKLYLQSSALSSAANGIVITDKEGIIVYTNPAVTKLTGYTFDELIGNNPRILKSNKHSKEFYKNIWDTIKSGKVWEGEIINKRKDGIEYTERQTITPVLDRTGDIEYFVAIKNDITERKKTEIALKESEEKLRNIIEHSNEMFYIHDTNHVVKYVSPQTEEFLGYTQEEMLVKWTELTTDNPINQKGFELTEKAIKTGERHEEYLLELRRKDGAKIFVQVSESPVKDANGKVTGIAGALRNITEKLKAERTLKESEKQFRGLYENAILGIYRTAPSGEIIMANPALVKLLGYNSFEEFKSIDASEALYENPDTRKQFKNLINEKGEVHGFEAVAKKKDGTKFFIRESARAVKDETGNIRYYEGIIEDITNQKEAEQKLIEAKETAESSDKLKTEFLAQMSHEIRTPINVILSFSNLIRDEVRGIISQELLNSFTIIDSASRRMIRTIDLILNMAQLQTGSYKLKKTNVDVYQEVLIQLYPEFSGLAHNKNLNFKINQNSVRPIIYADEYSVRQIFDNLIHNAIKYTHKGGIEINIYTNNNSIQVVVADTGIGISEEYMPNLFKPFTQEEHGYTRKYEGNGLGLALVKRYCELNDTQIKVESKKGEGTKFTLEFPAGIKE